MKNYPHIYTRPAIRAERRYYISQVTSSLIMAEDEDGAVLGFCEYHHTTIFVIEAFVYRKGIGRALVEALPHITHVQDVCRDAHPFWEAMGFEPIGHSRNWKRKEHHHADPK